jgi:hypothetical protein
MQPGTTAGFRPRIYNAKDLDCPVIADVDVLVIGGSQSGVAAAVSCARTLRSLGGDGKARKRSVLLVEQNTFLGGQSITNMVSQWKIPAFRMNVGKWRVKGIGIEMIQRIVRLGGSDKLWEDLVKVKQENCANWPFLGPDDHLCGEEALNIEAIKLGLLEMCDDAGVELLLDTRAVAAIEASIDLASPVTTGLAELPGSTIPRQIIRRAGGSIVEHQGGRGAILAKQVIDASANSVMAWWLGGEHGCSVNPPEKRGLTQSYIWVDGVDMDKLVDWVLAMPAGSFEMYPSDPSQLRKHVETGRLVWFKSTGMGQPESAFEAAEVSEDLGVLFKAGFTPVGFYFKWAGNYPKHGLFTVDGPYYREDSLDGRVWTSEHVRNLYGSWGLFRIMRHMPGFEHAYLSRTCDRMGLRTTRIPLGLYTITRDDLALHKEQPDAIGVGDWHDVSKKGQAGTWGYHVPFRALVSRSIDSLTFCGRAISFDAGAMNAHRTIGTTIVCAQGAGVGVAVALHDGVEPRHVNHVKVKEALIAQDVVLEIPTVTGSLKLDTR